ncbi:acyl carrier protein [Streptomyces sp. TRM 70351]|uniref:acyl carrier protein n=1 Tax=Streptomyces sp. TRM 70351 TaxID=3116552 RepID=UPI002E7BA6BA|nr:acyl carrier protein [Streptomyces sp. TRM 70351]MEE1927852.1 acyl carrier protein [Streptomyces sp. TRM 70351]
MSEPLRTVAVDHIARILGERSEDIVRQPRLDQYPGFSSFRMVDIVETLEERFDVTVPPDDLTADNLRNADRLIAALTRAQRAGKVRTP